MTYRRTKGLGGLHIAWIAVIAGGCPWLVVGPLVIDQGGGGTSAAAPVASIAITPDTATILAGHTLQLSATLRDANGNPLTGRVVMWASESTALATVSATGLVQGLAAGVTTITATSGAARDSAALAIVVTFASVSAGLYHTCGLTANGAAYCWGDNSEGALGDGSRSSRATPSAVQGGLTFATLTTGRSGFNNTCGLTAGGMAFCWGDNTTGALGDGTMTNQATPVAVQGAHSFVMISAGGDHTCGVATGGAAYCWGSNDLGQLGDTNPSPRTSPLLVPGGLTFSLISAGNGHTCGLTTGGVAYCWGENDRGELGDSSQTNRTSPVPVKGGLHFATLSAGSLFTCGLTSMGAAYCWGDNGLGALGDGTQNQRNSPVPVVGGLVFASLSGGGLHTCGLTAGGVAYCWGADADGQLGDSGTAFQQSSPVAVAGGLTFAHLGAGGFHSCAATSANGAYCWGSNDYLQLGIGSNVKSTVPVKVRAQP